MYKKSTRTIAALLIAVMLFAFTPFSATALTYTHHGEDTVTVGVELDYDALRTQAYSYVVNPAWTSLTSGASLTYSFRGQTYTETYNAARHFQTFAAAYTYFENRFKSGTALNSAFANVTPVFILAPGAYTESRLTVHGNAIILGSNAGVNPNAAINLDTANPTAGWTAASRYAETTLNNGVSFSLRSGSSTTNTRYESVMVAKNIKRLTFIVDGVNYNSTGNFLTLAEVSGGAERENFICIQNSKVCMQSSSFTTNDDSGYNGLNRYEFKNVRMDGTKTGGLFTSRAYKVAIDGLYFANSTGGLVAGAYMRPTLTFNMQNSYLYKITSSYPINFNVSSGVSRSLFLTLNGNIFYEVGSASYGVLVFHTSPNYPGGENAVTIINNTFLADRTVNTAARNTLVNGNTDYQQGAYSYYFRYNRVIGYTSMFPNLENWNATCTGDANYNYFAPTYSGYNDALGTRSAYFNDYGDSNKEVEGAPYCDPFRIENLIYYEDYAKTVYEGSTDVSGVSFYDDVDYVAIDNENSTISAGLTSGKAISDPVLYFNDPDTTATFYSNSACTSAITSIAAPAAGGTRTVYAMRRHGSVSKKMTITFYGSNDAVLPFKTGYTDPAGLIDPSSAYLLAPAVSSLSSGASYTATWQGARYSFTVGQNVFPTLAAIFSKAGSSKPQILVPYGSYGVMNLTAACELYGENYRYPAAVGSGLYGWNPAPGWSGGSVIFTNVTVSAPDTSVSGVEITGAVNDASRTSAGAVTFRNCVFNGSAATAANFAQFKITNPSVSGAANSYVLEGVRFKNIKTDSVTGSKILFGGTLPSSVAIRNCLFENVTRLFGSQWNGSLSDCSVEISGCRFENVSLDESLVTDAGTALSSVSFSLTDSVFKANSTGSAALMTLSAGKYASFTVTDNVFVNEAQSGRVMDVNYQNAAYTGSNVAFRENRAIGFADGIGALSQTDGVIDASYNYFAPFTESFSAAEDGAAPAGSARCTRCYADYALTRTVFPLAVAFSNKNGLTFNESAAFLELTLSVTVQTLDFTDGYMTVPTGAAATARLADGTPVQPDAVPLTDYVNTVILHVESQDNPYVFCEYTLKVYKEIPSSLRINYVSADVGYVTTDELTGDFTLYLPETSSSADVTVSVPYGSAWSLLYNGAPVNDVEDVISGEPKAYVIRVTDGSQSMDYDLTVIRATASGVDLDYESYVNTAYVINPAWSSVSSGSVSFYFRGVTRTQPYNAARHFASFDAAYAHWLSTDPDIIHDTPVFIFAPGTYSGLTVNYRAIILGANAGIDPNDPDADVTTMTPNDDIAENSARDTANETVFNGAVKRTTRVSGNDVLTLENAVQTAEQSSGESMHFYLAVDGVTYTGSATCAYVQDIDVGTRTDSANGISLTVTGRRSSEVILQNFRSVSHTGKLFFGQDTGFNRNSLTVKNMRMTGYSGGSLIQKYVDEIVFDGNYITGSTLSTGILDVNNSMNPRYDFSFVFKNNCFINNRFTRTIRYLTTPWSSGSYTHGEFEIFDNAFIETGSAEWGILSFSATVPDVTYSIHDNLFSQTGSYSGTHIKTVIEGNTDFYVGEMTMNVVRNRVIGASTILPNMQSVSEENCAKLHFSFDGNYLAPSFTSESDVAGVRPAYFAQNGTDPIHPATLDYYLDYGLTALCSEFGVTGVTFDGVPAEYSGGADLGPVTVSLPTDGTAALVFTAADPAVTSSVLRSGTVIDRVSYNAVLSGETDCTLRLTKGGVSVDLALTVLSDLAPLFSESYSDPTGEIKNTALVITADAQGAATGSTVFAEWRGKTYRFVAGVNAFASTDDIYALESQVLIPAGEHGNINVHAGMSVYGVNYDVDPNVKGSDISDDWTKNPKWGEFGESAVGDVYMSGYISGTSVTVKGVTMRARFFDSQRAISNKQTRITVENVVVDHTDWLAASSVGGVASWYTFNFANPMTREGSGVRDVGIMRNIRVENVRCNEDIANGRNRLLNEYLPADFTLDGVYVDCTASRISLFGWWKVSPNLKNGSLNIIGCNFRNALSERTAVYLYFEGRNHVNNSESQTMELNLRDNCFYNMQQTSTGIQMSLYAYSKLNITGNLFMNTTNRTSAFFGFADTATPNGILETNIYRNRFIGTRNYYGNPSGNSAADVTGNYYNTYSASYKTATTSTALAGSNVTNSWYYTDYALTTRSDGLNYSFTSDIVPDNVAKTLTLTLGGGIPAVSLNDYIASSGGCTFTLDGVSDNTAIPSAATARYPLTVSKGSLSEQWTFVINVLDVDVSALTAAIARAESTDTSGFRDFAVERIDNAVAAGRPLIHDPHITDESVALAALRINNALDIAERIVELEALIASARAIDTTLVDEDDAYALSAAIILAEQATDDPEVSLETLNERYTALVLAKEAITFGLNDFRRDIERATALIEDRYAQYNVQSTLTALVRARNAARTAYDGFGITVTPAEAQTAWNALLNAIDGLEPDVDYLDFVLSLAEEFETDEYCTPGVAAFESAIAAARAATITTAQDVGMHIEAVDAAQDALTEHNMSDFVYNGDATCTANGTETSSCLNHGCTCSETRTASGTALGHDYAAGFNATSHFESCTRCGVKRGVTAHSFDDEYDVSCSGCAYERTGSANAINPVKLGDDSLLTNDSVTVNCGVATEIDLSAAITNPYNDRLTLYADEEMELEISDLSAVEVSERGGVFWLKVASPDGAVTRIVTVNVVADSVLSVGISPAEAPAQGASTVQISWRGYVRAHGEYTIEIDDFSGEGFSDGSRRVGIIFASSDREDRFNEAKAALTASADDLDAGISAFNASSTSARLYAMASSRQLYWNDTYGAWTYRYNFNVAAGKTRAAMAFIVFKDGNGMTQVAFSEIDAQTATVN